MEDKFHKHRMFRELYNTLVHSNKGTNIDSFITSYNSVSPYLSFSGQPIRKVIIKQLDVFGPTIHDTTRKANTWIEQTSNRLHFQSKPYLITNNLFFKEGDLLNPVTIADDERLLRALPYLDDAKIIVIPAEDAKDSVDVLVITKDNWPVAFNIGISDPQSGNIQLWNRNLLGYGHQIENTLLWSESQEPKAGYHGSYGLVNISKTFINASISYLNAFQNESMNLSIDRTFITPNIKYGGGISLIQSKLYIPLTFDTTSNYTVRDNHYDIWLGRSFLFSDKNSFTKMRRNITVAARVIHDGLPEKPDITKNMYYSLQNKTLFLGSVAFTKQSYMKSNLIYNFCRTEDIPIGGVLQFCAGFENNQFGPRRYGGIMAGRSIYYSNLGYFYWALSAGSFIDDVQRLEQGIETASLHYYSPLFKIERYKFRQFCNIDYIRGINRFQDEYLSSNNLGGIPGYENDSVRGSTRLNIHLESVCFTPLSFYDFRIVFFVSGDFSWLNYSSDKILKNMPYSGIGLGIRIRNERLVFNTIQVRFSFYPFIPAGSTTYPFNLSGEPLLSLPTFIPQPPGLFAY